MRSLDKLCIILGIFVWNITSKMVSLVDNFEIFSLIHAWIEVKFAMIWLIAFHVDVAKITVIFSSLLWFLSFILKHSFVYKYSFPTFFVTFKSSFVVVVFDKCLLVHWFFFPFFTWKYLRSAVDKNVLFSPHFVLV